MSKSILAGAAVATIAGVMLGGAMRPQLIFDGRPLGPQMMATSGGPRVDGPHDNSAAYANYAASIPDYVTGTDYIQASAPRPAAPDRPERPERPERVQAWRDDAPAPPQPRTYARTAYDEPRTEVVYPSVYGGAAYEREAPPPPPPPEDDEPGFLG